MELGGYADNIAHVDLTSGTVEYKGIPEEWARKYIGARGLGVRYVFENGPTVEPLSPDNILCFMNGPLTGTAANMSGRMAIVTKSPLTGTVTDSHHGGWSAARLRWAGFDGLIFKGKADTPVYAYIEDGKVELRDASAVWGMGVHDTVKYFQGQFGEKDLTVITIGPAGEHLVRFASWVNENDRASGRGGTGCVGGSEEPEGRGHQGQEGATQTGQQGSLEEGPRSRPGRYHGRGQHHQPAQGRPVALWHQRAHEHHQHDGRAAVVERSGDWLW